MLFTKAAETLSRQFGKPTTTVRGPRPQQSWLLSCPKRRPSLLEVKLRGDAPGSTAEVEIDDPGDGLMGTREVLTVLQEPDIDLVVRRVRAHLEE